MMDCPACYCPFDIDVGVCPDCGHVLKSPDLLALERAKQKSFYGTLICILAAMISFMTKTYAANWLLCGVGLTLLALGVHQQQAVLAQMYRSGRRLHHKRSAAQRYWNALLAAAFAATLRMLLDPVLHSHAPFPIYFIVVMYVAWNEGFGPALLVTGIGVAVMDYFYIKPIGSFHVPAPSSLAVIVFYLVLGCFTALLASAQRKALLPDVRRNPALNDENAEPRGVFGDDSQTFVDVHHERRPELTAFRKAS